MKNLQPFTVYSRMGSRPQLRDKNGNIIAVFESIGGGYTTNQSPNQARRRAFKIARILNKS